MTKERERDRAGMGMESRIYLGRTFLVASALVWVWLGDLLLLPFSVSAGPGEERVECRSALSAALEGGREPRLCEGLREPSTLLAVLALALAFALIGLYALQTGVWSRHVHELRVELDEHSRQLRGLRTRLERQDEQLRALNSRDGDDHTT